MLPEFHRRLNLSSNAWLAFVCLTITWTTSFPFGFTTGVIGQSPNVVLDRLSALNVSSDSMIVQMKKSTPVIVFTISANFGMIIAVFCRRFKLFSKNCRIVLYIIIPFQPISALLALSAYFTSSYNIYLLSIILNGMYGGTCSIFIPLYLSKIVPEKFKAYAMCLHHLLMSTGLLMAHLMLLPCYLTHARAWPYGLSLWSIGNLFCYLLLKYFPDGLSNVQCDHNVYVQLNPLVSPVHQDSSHYSRLFDTTQIDANNCSNHQSQNQKWLVLSSLFAAQPLCGSTAVFYYGSDIFSQMKISKQLLPYCLLTIGIANFTGAMMSFVILNAWGRRSLVISSCLSINIVLCPDSVATRILTKKLKCCVRLVCPRIALCPSTFCFRLSRTESLECEMGSCCQKQNIHSQCKPHRRRGPCWVHKRIGMKLKGNGESEAVYSQVQHNPQRQADTDVDDHRYRIDLYASIQSNSGISTPAYPLYTDIIVRQYWHDDSYYQAISTTGQMSAMQQQENALYAEILPRINGQQSVVDNVASNE
ncbi:hypothetical protein ACOME3_009936 [Neoechinorhynchus agilis]